jgi:hypothetical protein
MARYLYQRCRRGTQVKAPEPPAHHSIVFTYEDPAQLHSQLRRRQSIGHVTLPVPTSSHMTPVLSMKPISSNRHSKPFTNASLNISEGISIPLFLPHLSYTSHSYRLTLIIMDGNGARIDVRPPQDQI